MVKFLISIYVFCYQFVIACPPMKFSVLENFSFFRRQKVVQFGKPGIGCKVTKYISNGNAFSQIFFLVSQKRRNEHLFSKSRIEPPAAGNCSKFRTKLNYCCPGKNGLEGQ